MSTTANAVAVEHSPLPWVVEIDDNGQANLYGADDQWIALMPHQCLGSLEALMHRNSKFIVRCVNSHADLLAALKTLVANPEEQDAHNAAHLAIAKAEGR